MKNQDTAVNELVAQLVTGTTYQMLDAAEAIGVHGEVAVDAVAPLLRSPDRETRWRAAVAMGRIGPASIEALLAAAQDPDYLVRIPAIWALEHLGDPRAVNTLVENLNGGNEYCRWMAAAALARIDRVNGRATVENAFADDPVGLGIVFGLMDAPAEGASA